MRRASLLAVAGGATVYVVALLTGPGRRLDEAVLAGLLRLGETRIEPVAEAGVHLADPAPYAVATATIVAVAAIRRRPRSALAAAIVLAGSALTTQALKPLLALTRETDVLYNPLPPASWPSGHTTAAVAVALCAVLVAPARMRPVVAALGGAGAAAIGLGTVALGWHYPSDVLGGVAVASAWAFALVRPRAATPVSPTAPLPTVALVLAGAAGLAGAVAARPDAALAYAADYTTAAVVAPVLALVAIAAVTAMATLHPRG